MTTTARRLAAAVLAAFALALVAVLALSTIDAHAATPTPQPRGHAAAVKAAAQHKAAQRRHAAELLRARPGLARHPRPVPRLIVVVDPEEPSIPTASTPSGSWPRLPVHGPVER